MGYSILDCQGGMVEKAVLRFIKAGLNSRNCADLTGIATRRLKIIAARYGVYHNVGNVGRPSNRAGYNLPEGVRKMIAMLDGLGYDLVDIAEFVQQDINAVYEHLCSESVNYVNRQLFSEDESGDSAEGKYQLRTILPKNITGSTEQDLAVLRLVKAGLKPKNMWPYFDVPTRDIKRVAEKYGVRYEDERGRPKESCEQLTDDQKMMITMMLDLNHDIVDIASFTKVDINLVCNFLAVDLNCIGAVELCAGCNNTMYVEVDARGKHLCKSCNERRKSEQAVEQKPKRPSRRRIYEDAYNYTFSSAAVY